MTYRITYQRVLGVGRVADNERALLVSFAAPPTDDELRSVHDYLRFWNPSPAFDTLPDDYEAPH